MINIGEQIVASYLEYVRGCEFIQRNLYTVESQGEIDVVGINLKERAIFVCEVAVHLTTGLLYVKEKRPNNIQKLTEKFTRDIEYANKFFADYTKHFMLWSPIVKGSNNPIYDQLGHLAEIQQNIRAQHGVDIECVVNETFLARLQEMRALARATTSEIKCPVMRLLQIEEHLNKHLGGVAPAKAPSIGAM